MRTAVALRIALRVAQVPAAGGGITDKRPPRDAEGSNATAEVERASNILYYVRQLRRGITSEYRLDNYIDTKLY